MPKQHGFSPNLWRQTPDGINMLLFHHENQIVFSAHGRSQLLSFMSIQRKAMCSRGIAGMNISGLVHQRTKPCRRYFFVRQCLLQQTLPCRGAANVANTNYEY